MSNYVLAHGAFVGGGYWSDVARVLQADAQVVRQAVEAVGDRVILVGHSYGGMVITELADQPAVAHSVYLTAFWPQPGQSLMDLTAGGPPLTWASPQDDGTLTVSDDLELLRQALCADVDLDRAEPELRRMLPQSLSSATSPSTAPDRSHPTTYIVCEQDHVVPPGVQEQMAAAADHVQRLPSSHQPMSSMPDRLAAVLSLVA